MKYTATQRKKALNLYTTHGATHAANETGISARSILRWANEACLSQVRAEKTEAARAMLALRHSELREELRVRLLEKALDALNRMDERHIDYKGRDAVEVAWEIAPSGAFKDYATGAAILIDKYRLEMGETTARTTVEGSNDIDRRVAQLVEEMGRRHEEAART